MIVESESVDREITPKHDAYGMDMIYSNEFRDRIFRTMLRTPSQFTLLFAS
jgi:hypothetical protein